MNNPPAFPVSGEWSQIKERGMTLRDYFAAKALQGIIASERLGDEEFATADMYARDAYRYADAMLKAREA
jgi:hypothetical protein